MADPDAQAGDIGARLLRLEEAQAFSEHTVEQLSGEIAELNKRLAEALAHIRMLESRLQRLLEPPEDVEEDAAPQS